MDIISIIICTVDRQPEYIHQTLGRLLFTSSSKKDIHLVVDGNDYKHLSTYKGYCTIYLNKVDKKCNTNLKRAAVNYARCLTLSKQLGGCNLILEDDVLLLPGWEEKLRSINIDEAKWILSLNNLQHKDSKKDYEKFFVAKEIPQKVWCETFAVIYSPKIFEDVIEEMLKISFYRNIAYDLSLGSIFFSRNYPIYEMVPSFVEHLGAKSHANLGPKR